MLRPEVCWENNLWVKVRTTPTQDTMDWKKETKSILQPLSPAAYCLHHLLDFCILSAWQFLHNPPSYGNVVDQTFKAGKYKYVRLPKKFFIWDQHQLSCWGFHALCCDDTGDAHALIEEEEWAPSPLARKVFCSQAHQLENLWVTAKLVRCSKICGEFVN